MSAIRSVPVSARTVAGRDVGDADLAAAQVVRGVKTNATAVPSGETAAPHSSPCVLELAVARGASRRGHASATSSTASASCPRARPRRRAGRCRARPGCPPRRASAAARRRRRRPRRSPRRRRRRWSSPARRRGSVSSQYGIGSRPVVRRCGGHASPSSSSSQTSDVSRSWMNTAVRPSAPIVSDRGRSVAATASSRQLGGGFRSSRAGRGTPSTSSLPSHTSSGSGIPMAFLESLQRREHEPADRGEIVPALLYDDDRQPLLADQRPASRKPEP